MNKLREEIYSYIEKRVAAFAEAEKDKEWPQVGDDYHTYTGGNGLIEVSWSGRVADEGRKVLGNCFKTAEDAEQDRDAKRVETELRSQSGRKAFVAGSNDWCLGCVGDAIKVEFWANRKAGLFQCYFESREAAQAALEAVGADRIKAAIDWAAATKEY